MKITSLTLLVLAVNWDWSEAASIADSKGALRKEEKLALGSSFAEKEKVEANPAEDKSFWSRLLQSTGASMTKPPTVSVPPTPTPPPDMSPPQLCSCNDDDLCTIDTCDANGQCIYTPVSCGVNESCDTFVGTCKNSSSVRTCVAVIDESSQLDSVIDTLWLEFKTTYPDRPFCLLRPFDPSYGELYTPEAFDNDPKTVQANVTRDEGNTTALSDWFTICGLNRLATSGIDSVGLFIDESSSMYTSTVQASFDKFVSDLNANGLNYTSRISENEDWITPFLVELT